MTKPNNPNHRKRTRRKGVSTPALDNINRIADGTPLYGPKAPGGSEWEPDQSIDVWMPDIQHNPITSDIAENLVKNVVEEAPAQSPAPAPEPEVVPTEVEQKPKPANAPPAESVVLPAVEAVLAKDQARKRRTRKKKESPAPPAGEEKTKNVYWDGTGTQHKTPEERYGLPERKEGDPSYLISIKKATQWWIDKSREHPAMFMEFVMGYEAAKHHLKWFDIILNPDNDRVLIVAPRESAKSTVLTVLMGWSIGHYAYSSNFIGSVTAAQAEDRLAMISDMIRYNSRYQAVFPTVAPDDKRGWTKSYINVKNPKVPYPNWRSTVTRYGSPKDHTLFAAGAGSGQVIGRRFSNLSVTDDLENEDNTATPDQREKLWRWYNRTYVNCVMAKAKVVHVTTRWNTDDLSNKLMNTPRYVVCDMPAITFKGDNERESYWPEWWPLERLDEKKDEIGSAFFEAMYMNNPLALAGDIFRNEWLLKDVPDPLPAFKEIYLSVDFALKKTARADYTVFLTVAVDRADKFYVLELVRDKMDPRESVYALGVAFNETERRYGLYPKVLMENVAFQSVMQHLLNNNTGDDFSSIIPPAFQVMVYPHSDKVLRARMGAARFEAGDVFLRQHVSWTPIFKGELLGFDREKYDDCVDVWSQVANYHKVSGGTRARVHVARVAGML